MKRIIAVTVMACMILTMLAGCQLRSDEALIRDRMEEFRDAYNSGDMEALLDCFDRRTRNTYRSALNVGNALIGLTGFSVGIEDLFSLGVGVMAEGDVMAFGEMEIELLSDTKAQVTVELTYQDVEYSDTYTATFKLVKEDNDWFIKE